MINVLGIYFWLGLLIAIGLIYYVLEQVEDRRAFGERRRQQSIERETAYVLRQMEQRKKALRSVAEWKRSQ